MQDQSPAIIGFSILAVGLSIATCSLTLTLTSDPLESTVASAVGFEIFLGLAAFAGAAYHRAPLRRLGLQPGRMRPGWIALAAIGTVGLSHALDVALTWSGLRTDSVIADLDTKLAVANPRALAFALIGLGLIPAFCEELLCRGLLQRGIAARCGPVLAVLGSSAAFGALHTEWIQGSAAFVLGLYIGSVSQLADSIRPAIVCHAANNLAAVLGGAFGPAAAAGLGITGGNLATAAAGLAIAVTAGVVVLKRQHPRSR